MHHGFPIVLIAFGIYLAFSVVTTIFRIIKFVAVSAVLLVIVAACMSVEHVVHHVATSTAHGGSLAIVGMLAIGACVLIYRARRRPPAPPTNMPLATL